MTIIETLVEEVTEAQVVRALCVGLFWTVVESSHGGCGVAATGFGWLAASPCMDDVVIAGAGTLLGQPLRALARPGPTATLPQRALGLAALNAAWPPPAGALAMDAEEVIAEHGRGKRIAVIGHFPFVRRLRAAGYDVEVYELEHRRQAQDRSAASLPTELGRADVVAITAATLLTGSTEEVLTWCRPGAFTLLLGPSTPLHPAMWGFGFSALCGSVVEDPGAAQRCAGQGATHHQLAGVRKVTYLRPPA